MDMGPDKDLIVFLGTIVLIIMSVMGFSVYEDIRMADAGFEQCIVKTDTGHRVVWQRDCSN